MQISLSFLDDPDGLNMSGDQRIQVVAQPAPVKYEIYVDNVLKWSGMNNVFTWHTSNFTDGTHVIRGEAVYKSRRSKTQAAVTTKNAAPPAASGYGAGNYGSGNYGG